MNLWSVLVIFKAILAVLAELVRGSREISLGPSLHRPSTDGLIIILALQATTRLLSTASVLQKIKWRFS